MIGDRGVDLDVVRGQQGKGHLGIGLDGVLVFARVFPANLDGRVGELDDVPLLRALSCVEGRKGVGDDGDVDAAAQGVDDLGSADLRVVGVGLNDPAGPTFRDIEEDLEGGVEVPAREVLVRVMGDLVDDLDIGGVEEQLAPLAPVRSEIREVADIQMRFAGDLCKASVAAVLATARRDLSVHHGVAVRPGNDGASIAARSSVGAHLALCVDIGKLCIADVALTLEIAADANVAPASRPRGVQHGAGEADCGAQNIDRATDLTRPLARGIELARDQGKSAVAGIEDDLLGACPSRVMNRMGERVSGPHAGS